MWSGRPSVRPSVCSSVSCPLTPPRVTRYVLSGGISIKFGTLLKVFQVMGSKVNDHGDPVNSIASELLKGFEPKLSQIRTTVGIRTGYVFKVMGSKVKVTERSPYRATVRRRRPFCFANSLELFCLRMNTTGQFELTKCYLNHRGRTT